MEYQGGRPFPLQMRTPRRVEGRRPHKPSHLNPYLPFSSNHFLLYNLQTESFKDSQYPNENELKELADANFSNAEETPRDECQMGENECFEGGNARDQAGQEAVEENPAEEEPMQGSQEVQEGQERLGGSMEEVEEEAPKETVGHEEEIGGNREGQENEADDPENPGALMNQVIDVEEGSLRENQKSSSLKAFDLREEEMGSQLESSLFKSENLETLEILGTEDWEMVQSCDLSSSDEKEAIQSKSGQASGIGKEGVESKQTPQKKSTKKSLDNLGKPSKQHKTELAWLLESSKSIRISEPPYSRRSLRERKSPVAGKISAPGEQKSRKASPETEESTPQPAKIDEPLTGPSKRKQPSEEKAKNAKKPKATPPEKPKQPREAKEKREKREQREQKELEEKDESKDLRAVSEVLSSASLSPSPFSESPQKRSKKKLSSRELRDLLEDPHSSLTTSDLKASFLV